MDLQELKKKFRSLQVIYTSIFLSIIIFAVALIIINKNIAPLIHITKDLKLAFRYVIIFILLGGVPLSYYLFERKVRKFVDSDFDLSQKYKIYNSSYILKLFIFEGIAFISMGMYLFSRDIYLLTAVLIVIVLLFINTPTITKLSNDLQLTDTEIDELYQ